MKKKMHNDGKKNNLNIVIVIFGAVIVILVGILVALLNDNSRVAEPVSGPEIDAASGEIVWEIDEEPEMAGELAMIGFHQLSDMGFMSAQYNKIVNAVKAYVTSEHPEYRQVSYVKNSFKYLDSEREKSSFVFVGNIWDRYKVNLDTHGELWDIEVKIERE